MNLVQNQTMSSLEIAKITNKRHPDVIRDIRSMIDSIKDDAEMLHELNQGVVDIKDNRSYTKEFKLNRFMTELLITGYDALRRAKVIKRLVELEQKELSRVIHLAVRGDSKFEYKAMGVAIQNDHEEIKPYHFSNEADLINRIVLGCTSSKFRKENDVLDGDAIRDYLTKTQLDCIISLQRANTVYIEDGINFQDRKVKLQSLFDRKFKERLIQETHLINA